MRRLNTTAAHRGAATATLTRMTWRASGISVWGQNQKTKNTATTTPHGTRGRLPRQLSLPSEHLPPTGLLPLRRASCPPRAPPNSTPRDAYSQRCHLKRWRGELARPGNAAYAPPASGIMAVTTSRWAMPRAAVGMTGMWLSSSLEATISLVWTLLLNIFSGHFR